MKKKNVYKFEQKQKNKIHKLHMLKLHEYGYIVASKVRKNIDK